MNILKDLAIILLINLILCSVVSVIVASWNAHVC